MEFTGTDSIFQQIASYYRRMIELGVYPPGSCLPSVREVALGEGVNPATVARAFRLLAEEGLVNAVEKKGYIVCKKSEDRKSQLKSILDDIRARGFSKEEIMEALSDD